LAAAAEPAAAEPAAAVPASAPIPADEADVAAASGPAVNAEAMAADKEPTIMGGATAFAAGSDMGHGADAAAAAATEAATVGSAMFEAADCGNCGTETDETKSPSFGAFAACCAVGSEPMIGPALVMPAAAAAETGSDDARPAGALRPSERCDDEREPNPKTRAGTDDPIN
jgi:hypothetical protein